MTAFVVVAVILMIGGSRWVQALQKAKKENIFKRGYDLIIDRFYTKDGTVFYLPLDDLKRAIPIEIVGVREITRNAKLIQLEIRYRVNGTVKAETVGGSPNELLTAEDKFGYGG
jgi:hypothetical protein